MGNLSGRVLTSEVPRPSCPPPCCFSPVAPSLRGAAFDSALLLPLEKVSVRTPKGLKGQVTSLWRRFAFASFGGLGTLSAWYRSELDVWQCAHLGCIFGPRIFLRFQPFRAGFPFSFRPAPLCPGQKSSRDSLRGRGGEGLASRGALWGALSMGLCD